MEVSNMKKNDFTRAHELMTERLESENYFHKINSLDLSYSENEILLSLEMNGNNELIYRLQMDMNEDFIMLTDFQEDISIEHLVDSYLSLGDLLSGSLKHDYYGLGWGRLTWLLINSSETKIRKMDMNVAFVENPSGVYDGSEDYFKISFGMDTVVALKQFIKDSYEIINKQVGL